MLLMNICTIHWAIILFEILRYKDSMRIMSNFTKRYHEQKLKGFLVIRETRALIPASASESNLYCLWSSLDFPNGWFDTF